MIRRFKSTLVPAALLALCPLAAQAGDPLSYSYIEGQYLNTRLTTDTNGKAGKPDSFEGYRYGLNLSVYKFVYLLAETDNRRAQKYRQGFQSIGFGAHTQPTFARHLQLFGDATYERRIFNDVTNVPGRRDDKDEGYGAEAGVRAPWGSFEAHASYRYMNYGETDKFKVTGARYGGGVVVQLSPYFALTGDYRFIDIDHKGQTGADGKEHFKEYLAGFRAYFATDIDRWRRRGGIFSGGDEAPPSAQ